MAVVRSNAKSRRNDKIVNRYEAILKRMGSISHLTPQGEIMDEIAEEFDIRASTVSRIIKEYVRKGAAARSHKNYIRR